MLDPVVCKLCAAKGPTCCEITPGQEEFCFPLSDLEMDRIREVAPARGWFAQEVNSEAFVSHVARLFPGEEDMVAALFPPRKHHFRLAVDAAGRCAFLGETGCRLSAEVRPHYCRLFPVWIVDARVLVLDSNCEAKRQARGSASLLESVGLTPAKARELHARLRMAWGLPPKRGMQRVKPQFARNGNGK